MLLDCRLEHDIKHGALLANKLTRLVQFLRRDKQMFVRRMIRQGVMAQGLAYGIG